MTKHTAVPATHIILRKGDETLFLKRANTKYMAGSYAWPGGHIEPGESAIGAAIREAKEELGIIIKKEHLTLKHVMDCVAIEGDHERIIFFFETTTWQNDPKNVEPQKCTELRWIKDSSLPENVDPRIYNAVRRIGNGEYYSNAGY